MHKNDKVIDAEVATLADLNIFPGDQLWVRDSEIHENRDIAGKCLSVTDFEYYALQHRHL